MKHPMKKAPLCPKMYQVWGGVGGSHGVGWGRSYRGGVGHVGVGWGGSFRSGLGWVM